MARVEVDVIRRPSGRALRWSAGLGAAALLAAQAIPVARTNPPGGADPAAPAAAVAALRRACYDCHSNETVWPWYSRVAPVSWLVAHDVSEGRAAVNYSRWADYSEGQRAELAEETWEEIAEGEMPPLQYTLLHPAARLDDRALAALRAWARSEGTAGSAPRTGER